MNEFVTAGRARWAVGVCTTSFVQTKSDNIKMSRDQHNGHRHITRCPAPSAVISMTEARWVTGEQHPVIGHFHVDTAIVKAKSGFGPVRYL